ncbi:MAG: hypothetical protein ACTHYR_04330 [Brachybacterium sp.]
MRRELTFRERIYTGSITFLHGAIVTMAEPGGRGYARVTVRQGNETHYLADVGRDSITTVVHHRTVRRACDYVGRAKAATRKAYGATTNEAERLAHYAALCARAAQRLAATHPYGWMDEDATEAADWAATAAIASNNR